MPIYWCNVYFHFVIVSETAVQVFRNDFLRTVDLTVWFTTNAMTSDFLLLIPMVER